MSLLAWPFLALMAGLALACLAGVWAAWQRWPHKIAIPARAVSLLLVMVMGAVLGATLVNRQFGFYANWSDLLATSARVYEPPKSFTPRAADSTLVILTADWEQRGAEAARQGKGSLLEVIFVGPVSRISRPGLLYLPADYFKGLSAGSLPVVEMFHGYPGGPTNFDTQLNIRDVLDTEIAARRMPAVIGAFPTTYQGKPSECIDTPGGERNETYLAVDVPAAIENFFKLAKGRTFAALGYSQGGFCAINIGLHHPDRFSAAASLSGYFTAGIDTGTGAGSPYLGKRATVDENSPLWWLEHRAPTGPALYLTAGALDKFSIAQSAAMRQVARTKATRLPLVVTLVPNSGHNFGTWSASLPAALDFLGQHLPTALAPPLVLPTPR